MTRLGQDGFDMLSQWRGLARTRLRMMMSYIGKPGYHRATMMWCDVLPRLTLCLLASLEGIH